MRLSAVIFIFLFPIFSVASDPTTCDSSDSINYCFYPGSKGTDQLVVYMHGVTRTARDWEQDKVTKEIVKHWDDGETIRPHVVSLSGGRFWWYEEESDGAELVKALKVVEEKFLSLEQREGLSRRLIGDSMGGHNSLRLASDHKELFDHLVVICPAIPKTFTEVRKGSNGTWPFNSGVERVFRGIYPLKPEQDRRDISDMFNFSELHKFKTIHVAATPRDHYGFYSGNLDFKDRLTKVMGEKVSYQEENVRHCLVNGRVVAEKLIQ